jgi:glutamine amidotransferase
MNSIAIIDYGMGNLHSIAKAVEHVAADSRVTVTSSAEDILSADRVIFPGVGGIGHCMQAIIDAGLDQVVVEAAATKPFLGICVGLQALLDSSEENDKTRCLGVISGKVLRFDHRLTDDSGNKLKIPHMGWNQVTQVEHPLWDDIAQNSRFYFVHSYFAMPDDIALVSGRTDYGGEIACALARENLFAVQFHPEKSQHAGLALLKNFSQWDGTV